MRPCKTDPVYRPLAFLPRVTRCVGQVNHLNLVYGLVARKHEITVPEKLLRLMLSQKTLRFRLRRGNFEIELEGEYEYVKGKFEELMKSQTAGFVGTQTVGEQSGQTVIPGEELTGILETTPEGKLHFTIPFDKISAKEAIGLILYGSNPSPIEDANLIGLLQTSWKSVKDNVVRARVSELRKEGKLIAEQGRYSLSGAGIQWITQEVLPKVRPLAAET